MAISGKYGEINIPGIGPKEPVFVLRAQDKLAGPTIEMYRSLASSHGSPIVGALAKEIERFQQWQGNKKLPD
jgi:flavorubredoxin